METIRLKHIWISILALCVSLNAEPFLAIEPDKNAITITVSDYPIGKAVALLTSDGLTDWTLATDVNGKFIIYYAEETNEPISWRIPVNKDGAFYKAIVLNYS
jgi:hypothetical protein